MSPQQQSLVTFIEVMNAAKVFTSAAERELFVLFVAARLVQWAEEGVKQ